MWQRPGLEGAEGEAMGPDLGHQGNRSGAEPRAAAPSPGYARGRAPASKEPREGDPPAAAGGFFQPLGWPPPSAAGAPPAAPRTEEGVSLVGKDGGGGGRVGREAGRVDLGTWGFLAFLMGIPELNA